MAGVNNIDGPDLDQLEELLRLSDFIGEEKFIAALAKQLNLEIFDFKTQKIDPAAVRMIPEQMARENCIVAVAQQDERIYIVISDPRRLLFVRDDVRFATGKEVEVMVGLESLIKEAIDRYYDVSKEVEQALDEFESQRSEMEIPEVKEDSDADVSASPVVRLVNSIVSQAVKINASDVHIEPFETFVRVRYRVDGVLREIMRPPKSMLDSIMNRVKIIGGMDISEKRKPQDGRVEMIIEKQPIDLRISILPTIYGEKGVLRLLKRSGGLLDLEKLGFSEGNRQRFANIIKAPEGMVLLTGPTGSGKTTTLYSVLNHLNQIGTNIITVEDPVEYRLEGINQVQVNVKAGLTFASGLRSILRQDPDIVLVGEIRDEETAEIAFRAAITGHLVLSTLHTNDAASTLTRLIDMNIDSYLVSSAVVGIVAQRLVRKLCPDCKEAYQTEDTDMQLLELDEPTTIYKSVGCNRCGGSGYRGRTGIHEVLEMGREIREYVNSGRTVDEIRDLACSQGMTTLQDSCRELVLSGQTSVEQMLKVTYSIE